MREGRQGVNEIYVFIEDWQKRRNISHKYIGALALNILSLGLAICLWRAVIRASSIRCGNKVQCDTRPIILDIEPLMVRERNDGGSEVNARARAAKRGDDACVGIITG